MKLRDYQHQAIRDTYQFFRSGLKSILIYSPTGSGKTVIASRMIADAVARGRRVLFLVHRTKLIDQTAATLKNVYGIECGVIWADVPPNPDAPVQIAMVQTIQNRDLPPDIGLVVIDETHTTAYYQIIQKVMTTYSGGVVPLSPCYFIGLSATPWRTKKKEGYCQFFQATVRAPHPEDLIKMGHLAYARHFGWNGLIDFSQLDTGADGDYTQASMQKACDPEFNALVVRRFMELCPERKTIAFCSGVQQAYDLAAQFNDAGIVSEVVVGSTSEDSRNAIYHRFKSGETQLISSVSCLCEGFDETSCDAAIIARPTKSRALMVQMAGRALRLHPGKQDALLLDFCENFRRLGVPTKAYPTPLCPSDKQEPFIPTKECPECHAAVPQFAKVCPECGYEFSQGEEPEQEGGSNFIFGEILTDDQKKQCSYLRQQLQKAFKANRDIGRVSWLFWRKYNYMPPLHWYRDAIFRRGKSVHEKQRQADQETYKKFLKENRPNAPKGWIADMLRREFGCDKYYNLQPIEWWKVLGMDATTTNWDVIKQAYQNKIAFADAYEAALLNFCLLEARSFCNVMSIKGV
ncbi:DEAD/DEAH box helicase [Scytonema sp. PCC 10023]|uniref:DEAD/DEAH box helicase n=1 Tax=Scytonema sp. PCC 10023 TaxID=1680591 RepID=UPI0039C6E2C9